MSGDVIFRYKNTWMKTCDPHNTSTGDRHHFHPARKHIIFSPYKDTPTRILYRIRFGLLRPVESAHPCRFSRRNLSDPHVVDSRVRPTLIQPMLVVGTSQKRAEGPKILTGTLSWRQFTRGVDHQGVGPNCWRIRGRPTYLQVPRFL